MSGYLSQVSKSVLEQPQKISYSVKTEQSDLAVQLRQSASKADILFLYFKFFAEPRGQLRRHWLMVQPPIITERQCRHSKWGRNRRCLNSNCRLGIQSRVRFEWRSMRPCRCDHVRAPAAGQPALCGQVTAETRQIRAAYRPPVRWSSASEGAPSGLCAVPAF